METMIKSIFVRSEVKAMESGIYEKIISMGLKKELEEIADNQKLVEKIDDLELPLVLSNYVAKIVRDKLNELSEEKDAVKKEIELVNDIISRITGKEKLIDDNADELKAICEDAGKINLADFNLKTLQRPLTVSNSLLFTGATRQPSLFTEMKKEIVTSNRIDMIVSFIRWSGLVLLLEDLKKFTENGGKLRVITTTYMKATELKAINELSKLSNTEIHISYDTRITRLHAKAYVFYRNTGYSTAYIGSSNLTKPAMKDGLEWNVKVTLQDNYNVFRQVEENFEAYWKNDIDFELYQEKDYNRLKAALAPETQIELNGNGGKRKYYFEPHPFQYQKAILEKLDSERKIHNNYKNLIVAATGTGKTIISAFDYKYQCSISKRRLRLLYVAHRIEILLQAIECYREVLNDPNFGELCVGSYKPNDINHLFVSIDMLESRGFYEYTAKDAYEYIIIDECHHMAAKSYSKLINYYEPKYFVGLTATPERMDEKDILQYFNNHISAEIRLPEAVDRKILCPFQYYGVADNTDLSELRWARGGYDNRELEKVYVLDKELAKKRVSIIVSAINRYASSITGLKALAFCVSIDHARFMSESFNGNGIKADYLIGGMNDKDRNDKRKKLINGEIKILCVVDVYNEGVDIKEINTVLFLRPTESLTVFLQQFGRGLRHAEGKDCLTVLDFVGQANKRYDFESRFNSLLGNSNRGLKDEIESGFPDLPKGCYIRLEKKVQKIVLENIRNSIGYKNGLLEKIRDFYESSRDVSLYSFLKKYEISPRKIYCNKFTFAQAINVANRKNLEQYNDVNMWKKLYRLSEFDSKDALEFYLKNINLDGINEDPNDDNENSKGYWRMLFSTLIEDYNINDDSKPNFKWEVKKYLDLNKNVIPELLSLFEYRLSVIDIISKKMDMPFDCPLDVYCTYTRKQILSALDYWNNVSEGVARIRDKKTTCLFITLNKGNAYYSETTSYHDYSINDELFHWQSQNATSSKSKIGQLYINHKKENEKILLFVREAKEDRFGSLPYTLLGEAEFVEYTGSKPMNIIWKLKNKIPAKFVKVTDKSGIA